jgi:hypothetical protein
MLKQKENYKVEVNNVEVEGWDASVSFTSDPIEFEESTSWALSVDGYAGLTPGSPTISILHSNSSNGDFLPYKSIATSIDITTDLNRVIFDDSFFARYMKVQYVSGGSTGTFDLILSK